MNYSTACHIQAFLAASALLASGSALAQSTCFGRVGDGRIENAVSLPREGANFVRLSQGPVTAGRVYVHSTVKDILMDTWSALAADRPKIRWVYGETGLPTGGPMPPHQTHQNGTSVDLFVPVVDRDGNSVPFPNRPENGFGYQVTFDSNGENASHAIDYANLAELLYQLHVAAKNHGSGLALVVFQRELRPRLFATARGRWLKDNVPFPDWDDRARHDKTIHVDFALKCM